MRGLKFSLIIGSCLTLSGCSSIWSGVSDFADLMAEKTSFRKSSHHNEIVAKNATPDQNGQIKSSAGYYVPSATTSPSQVDCPDGSYLTAEGTCMLQALQNVQMSELRGLSTPVSYNANTMISSGIPDCPSGTYLTADNTCMQTAQVTPSYANNSYSPYSIERLQKSLTGPLICPPGMILEGAYDCRFEDPITPQVTPVISTNPISYSYEYACPMGSYKDPDNICMRSLIMP